MTERKIIQDNWAQYRKVAIHADAGAIQLAETERAFYAGATAVFGTLVKDFETDTSDATEATENDLALMDDIAAELIAFAKSQGWNA